MLSKRRACSFRVSHFQILLGNREKDVRKQNMYGNEVGHSGQRIWTPLPPFVSTLENAYIISTGVGNLKQSSSPLCLSATSEVTENSILAVADFGSLGLLMGCEKLATTVKNVFWRA